jgi:hypothetical protein
MPTFIFKNEALEEVARVSAPPGSFVYGCDGPCDPDDVQVGGSIRVGGGGFLKVDEIIADEV